MESKTNIYTVNVENFFTENLQQQTKTRLYSDAVQQGVSFGRNRISQLC